MYPVNEIFYSLQGEGFHSGTPATFIRFSGCNLRCPFCDTDTAKQTSYTTEQIIHAVKQFPTRFVVLTGGEPALFADDELISALHSENFFIAVETNGTKSLPENIDWITCSPKNFSLQITRCDELKLIFQRGTEPDAYAQRLRAKHLFLQPCRTNDRAADERTLHDAINFCLQHPQWRLSIQTHKLLHFK